MRTPAQAAVAIAGFALSLFLCEDPARAEPRARFVYLRGAGTESCPSEVEVRQAVQVRLGYDPFSTYAASTMFTEVAAMPSGFSASLKLVDADNAVRGDRKLEVRGACPELMDAMALSISIAIDPMSITRDGPPPDAPPSEKPVSLDLPSIPNALPAPEAPSEAAAPASPRPDSPLLLSLSLGPVVSLGNAPAVAVGGLVGADAQRGWLFGGVEGRADAPSSRVEGVARVESSLISGALFAGVRQGPLFACIVGSAGRLSATSEGVAEPRERSSLVLASGVRAGVALPVADRVELRARLEGLASPTRHTLTIDGAPVFEYPVLSASAAAGVAIRFR
jgi:hypothetical protein